MYYAITVYGGTITGVHESLTPINEVTFKNSQAYREHLVIPVNEEHIENARQVVPGKYWASITRTGRLSLFSHGR